MLTCLNPQGSHTIAGRLFCQALSAAKRFYPLKMENMSSHIENAEKTILQLTREIADLENSVKIDPEIEQLEAQNKKLKYQIVHLQRALEKEKCNRMVSFPSYFSNKIKSVVSQLYPGIDVKIEVGPNSGKGKNGDYQCSSSFLLAKELAKSGQKSNPREVALKLSELIKDIECVEKVEITGPGFLNFYLQPKFVNEQIQEILVNGVRGPPCGKKQRVFVDFSSPNIAKEMHVGHLRSTIIGDVISRLLEFIGHEVFRVNHLGDWGTQFGMLIAHLEDTFPNYITESPPIEDLQAFYKESKKRFDQEPDFKKRAYLRVVELQGGKENIIQGWQLICDISLREFNKIYERLNIVLDPVGESFYQKKMETLVPELDASGKLTLSDGCKLIFVEGEEVPLMVVKSDGGYTYDTSDLAAIHYRMVEREADWGVYVVDSGQSLHFSLLFAAARSIGIVKPTQKITHVGFGVVLGEDRKKFKTRSGDTVKLKNLLDEGLERAERKIRAKEEEKKEKGSKTGLLSEEEIIACRDAVTYGCIKFADLSCTRTNDYVFSFDKMLDDKGKTAVYLLYALTRIRSIARNAGKSRESLLEHAKHSPITLEHEAELKLAKTLLRFAEVIEEIAETLQPHTLCNYLYDISTVFTYFYDNCYCIQKNRETGEIINIHMDRLLLVEATAQVMEKCFDILGIKTVSRM